MIKLKSYSKTDVDVSSPNTSSDYFKELIYTANNFKSDHEIDVMFFIPKKCERIPNFTHYTSIIKYRLFYNISPKKLFHYLIPACYNAGLYLDSYWPGGLQFHALSGLFATVELNQGNTIYACFYSLENEKAYAAFIVFRGLLRDILESQRIVFSEYLCNNIDDLFSIKRVIREMEKNKNSNYTTLSDEGNSVESPYSLFGIKQDNILELNNLKNLLGIKISAEELTENYKSSSTDKPKKKKIGCEIPRAGKTCSHISH